MLVQTNDGFTGLDDAALTDGSQETQAYDAGTEDLNQRWSESPKDSTGDGRPGTRSSYWNLNFAGHVSYVSIRE